MARPQNKRMVYEPPLFTDFKPVGVRVSNLAQVQLTLDEFEAFRLVDFNSLSVQSIDDEPKLVTKVPMHKAYDNKYFVKPFSVIK